jgi:hypothetical protein
MAGESPNFEHEPRFARDPRDPPGCHQGQPATRSRLLRTVTACRSATRHDRGPRAGPLEKPGPRGR